MPQQTFLFLEFGRAADAAGFPWTTILPQRRVLCWCAADGICTDLILSMTSEFNCKASMPLRGGEMPAPTGSSTAAARSAAAFFFSFFF